MSSYLNIYGVPKNGEYYNLLSFSRSHPIYSAVTDNINIAYNSECKNYTELTTLKILEVLLDLDSDIQRSKKRIIEYEKYAINNSDLIIEIISNKEYLEELETTKHQIEILQMLIFSAENKLNSFNKIYCNID